MVAVLQGAFGRTVLGPRVLTIGRALDNQLVVNNPTASSHHAEIRPGDYGYSLIDLGSTNGTFVNDQQLDRHIPYVLQTGDRLRFGDVPVMYYAGRPDLQGPLVQQRMHADVPTAKVRAISQSEQFGYKPPAPYSSYTPQQPPAPPSFTPAFQQPNTPLWATDRATSYGVPEQQPPPPSFTPAFQQSNTPPWATDRASGYGMPVQPLPYTSPAPMQPLPYAPPVPVQPKSSNRLKVLLIVLSVILILGAGGGGIAAYRLTRPQPVMTVISIYNVGSTPAGSTGTVLHVGGHSFSGSSAITFLLDNVPVASNQNVSSDADGNVKAELTVTNAWTVGNHTLTAKDASGYATKASVTVAIVPQGQAHTPGPNGAPPDDMSFSLNVSLQVQDAGTGQQLGSYTQTLTVTGKPDPAGGTVCQARDDGRPYTYTGNAGNGITYREIYVLSCSGTYKGSKLIYTETTTSDKVDFYKVNLSNALSCQAHTPYVFEHLEGTFTSQNTISGTLTSDSVTLDCNQGVGTQQYNAKKGSWTAQM